MRHPLKKLVALLTVLATASQPLTASALTWRVSKGDTLSSIARATGNDWHALAKANHLQDPNRIFMGQRIELDAGENETRLGAALPVVIANYQDSLASKMSSSASSFTLVNGYDGQSRSLSGLYGFVIDEGSAVQEFVTANCTGTACTVATRGIDLVDGKTNVASLQQEHRRGATVKITDYPLLALLMRMLNGAESIPGVIYSSSTTYVPPSAASFASKYYVDSVGAGGFTANNVSSTLGLQAISSGIPNCPSAAACVGLNVSSTGGLAYDTAGRLILSGVVGTSTIFNSSVSVQNPTSTSDAASYMSLLGLYATGTAGTSTSPGQAVYLSSTGTLYLTSTAGSSTVYEFVGIAQTTTTAGGTVIYARPGGIAGGFKISGLTTDRDVFLADASGTVSNSPGTIPARIGRALSSGSILLQTPSFQAATSGSFTIDANTIVTTTLSTIWQPTRVNLICASTALTKTRGSGLWLRNTDGTSQQSSVYSSSTTAYSPTSACAVTSNSSVTVNITVATSTSGFTIANTASGAGGGDNVFIEYFAEYNGIYPAH